MWNVIPVNGIDIPSVEGTNGGRLAPYDLYRAAIARINGASSIEPGQLVNWRTIE
ncbi:hypothetical protein [Paenibacillus sp. MBLB4367]|uniref:hypothetical protein n=1 Tax=Paenibacillus sp. MBLB4367 TaxID=3384767 RepID=UPI0039081D94